MGNLFFGGFDVAKQMALVPLYISGGLSTEMILCECRTQACICFILNAVGGGSFVSAPMDRLLDVGNCPRVLWSCLLRSLPSLSLMPTSPPSLISCCCFFSCWCQLLANNSTFSTTPGEWCLVEGSTARNILHCSALGSSFLRE